MRISKIILKIAAFLLVFVLINSALVFVLSPYKGSGEEMWSAYDNMGDIDMVYAGSSQCISDIDPEVIDKSLGTLSFNMGTNMQSFHNSYIALATAIAQHKDTLRRVVLVVDYEMLDTDRYDNFRAEASFYHARSRYIPGNLFRRAADEALFAVDKVYLGKPSSINYFFSWIYDRNPDISLNVREKLAGRILDEEGHRTDRGFLPSDEELGDLKYISLDEAKDWGESGVEFQELTMSVEVEDDLRNIAGLCRDNDIELIAITVPYPTFVTIYSLEDYAAMHSRLIELFNGYGFDYYDFNLVIGEVYRPDRSYFKDQGHMNTYGAQLFSRFFAEFLKWRDGGKPVNDYFLSIN
ncbi:hypothetical protein [Butyrivibrio sp. MC2013]|uniref:hypothetical protein n=1 Tax=Butyrivibrio sp. MC2013 TaxID=1280686 RepID=UPI0004103366|nr:hypothetical protein [Butyrivibrio sp. MC2013]